MRILLFCVCFRSGQVLEQLVIFGPGPVQGQLLLETIGYIGTSLEGKSDLIELGNIMADWLDKLITLGQLIRLKPANQVTSTNQSSINSELTNYRVST